MGNVAGVSDSDTFGARSTLEVGGESYEIFRLDALQEKYDVARLPYALKVLLENLLRNGEDEGVEAVAQVGRRADEPSKEIAYRPARVLMQDFTGVPAIVDLAAMRDAMEDLGGDATKINPLVPVELVIDHSIQVDVFAERLAFQRNAEFEFERNKERYAFLRWGQTAFDNFKVVPPNTGICHQVNLEYLARVVESRDGQAFPDTLVGTDSHTTMVNGLGVLGWGVGGIEAEAAMLGQPVSMLVPQVVGFRLTGELPEGATATDLVLTVTEMLRERGVVSKFVEFHGDGLANLPLADRATIGNMSPEMGATCAIFPVDAETLRYLEFSGRPPERIELVEAYCREQGLFHDENFEDVTYSDTLELALDDVVPSLAGPKRPQDRVALTDAASDFRAELEEYTGHETPTGYDEALDESFPSSDPPTNNGGGESPKVGHSHPQQGTAVAEREEGFGHGSVVIAAITSCTNTSNPSVMIGAGLLAKKAVEAGLERMPWVKTSLAPGSKVVTEYLERAGLIEPLSRLGFDLVGYGCTTCIGNSGPLPEDVSKEIEERDLVVASVLSGNRNFEGRIHPEVKMNYLASPPLCVAYALAGRMDLDIVNEPLQNDVYLRDIWPTQQEVNETIESAIESDMFRRSYGDALFEGDDNWQGLEIPEGDRYAWDDESTYVKQPPYFEDMPAEAPDGFEPIEGARVIALLGDSVTTDHISPAGAIKKDSPGGRVPDRARGRAARVQLLRLAARQPRGDDARHLREHPSAQPAGWAGRASEGGFTKKDGEVKPIYDAAVEYHEQGTPLCVIAGKEYGSGSSRDWAAKGPRLLGVRFVIAESYERIHRSNLVGMGILPLQFPDGENAESLGLTGEESFDLAPLEEGAKTLKVTTSEGVEFDARVRIDTPNEWLYYRHDGILHYVLRDLLQR